MLRGKVGVPAGPMRLSGLVNVACAITNGLVERSIHLEVLQGRKLSCQAGCGACCRHMVPISAPEAFHIADVVERLAPPRRALVEQRFDAIVARLEREHMVAELLDPSFTSDPYLPVARKYFSLQTACPFLEDESCTIHADRPVTCRDYNVTSPAAWCARPYEHEVAKVPTPMPLAVPLARLTSRLTGLRPQLTPLTLAPRWVREHDDIRRRVWPGPELLDGLLAEMGAPGAATRPGSGASQ